MLLAGMVVVLLELCLKLRQRSCGLHVEGVGMLIQLLAQNNPMRAVLANQTKKLA